MKFLTGLSWLDASTKVTGFGALAPPIDASDARAHINAPGLGKIRFDKQVFHHEAGNNKA